jgi:hypothetical protein
MAERQLSAGFPLLFSHAEASAFHSFDPVHIQVTAPMEKEERLWCKQSEATKDPGNHEK